MPPPYRNSALPIRQRVRDLLDRMTITEKVGQLNQRMFGWDAYTMERGEFRLTDGFVEEVERWQGMGALYGLFRADPWSGRDHTNGIPARLSADAAGRVQRWVREHTRLGIPVLLVEEVPHGHQAVDGTVLPVNLAVASSWDPAAYRDAVSRVAAEVRGRGAHVALVSALDMLVDPRWGRSEECFGEDPHLAAEMTRALVVGMQGESSRSGEPSPLFGPDKLAVVLKHFAGQGAGAGGLNANSVSIGERELHEIHLPAARAGVRAGVAGLMAAYNDIDGVPCAGNAALLTDLLRDEWGFDGIVMADGGGIDRLQMVTGGLREAGVLALRAGIDLSLWDGAYTHLESALEDGLISEQVLDRSVARVLQLKFRLGLFDTDETDDAADPATPALRLEGPPRAVTPPQRDVALQLAERSLVLLQNRESILPLRLPATGRVAVMGPNALDVVHQIGDYTTVPVRGTGWSVLEGVRQAATGSGRAIAVEYTRGCGFRAPEPGGLEAARSSAAGSDVAILVLGGSSARQPSTRFAPNGAAIVDSDADPHDESAMTCGEGVDLADVTLPEAQLGLARAVAATGTPVIAVLIQGRPHALGDLPETCAAILCAWYPGSEGGLAVGSALFGDITPAGRLPVSIPTSSTVLPVAYNARRHHHTTYVDRAERVMYPFGFGLGYTTYRYIDLSVTPAVIGLDALRAGATAQVTVSVRAVEALGGEEVVQVYLRRMTGSVWPRERELKAFRRLAVQGGETVEAAFELGFEELACRLPGSRWDVELGTQQITVGGLTGTLELIDGH